MKFIRFEYNSTEMLGIVKSDGIHVLKSLNIFDAPEFNDMIIPENNVRVLPPVMPSKIVAVGKNYLEHALEMKEGVPTEPLLFLKPSTSIIGHNDEVVYPSISNRLDYEGELAVIIGKRCRNVTANDALDYVFGYTCLNDVTARDIQKSDPQWTRGKGFDTFCPIGPYLETEIDASDLAIETRLNDKVVQSGRTSMMMHKIDTLIEFISRVMTLLPGDIIATGTPSGIGPMQAGDKVAVTIEGLGTLVNTIIAE